MSHPNTPPPGDPYGQGRQHSGQEGTGGYLPPTGHQSGGYPPHPGQQQPGGYPPPPAQQPGGYPPLPPGQPGYGQQPGYGAQPGYGQPSPDEKQMAFFAHVGGGLFSWIVPLIIFLIKKDESPFVRREAAAALNFQLVIMIGYVISYMLMIVFIGGLTWLGLLIFSIVSGVQRGQAVNRGEASKPYPFDVKWVK